MLSTSFGYALSKLPDASIIGLGVVVLTCGILVVMIQGSYLSGKLDERDAIALADPSDLMRRSIDDSDQDRFNVRSYSLLIRADLMQTMHASITADDLIRAGVHMSESGLVQCGDSFISRQISFANDSAFLVVVKGSVGDRFHRDVSQASVSSIMLGGGVFRIRALSEVDFSSIHMANMKDMFDQNDMYVISTGSIPNDADTHDDADTHTNTSTSTHADVDTRVGYCKLLAVYMPWSQANVMVNVKAVDAIAMLTSGASSIMTRKIHIWGLGGR